MYGVINSTLYKASPQQLHTLCNHTHVLIIYSCILQSTYITNNVQYITHNFVAHT